MNIEIYPSKICGYSVIIGFNFSFTDWECDSEFDQI